MNNGVYFDTDTFSLNPEWNESIRDSRRKKMQSRWRTSAPPGDVEVKGRGMDPSAAALMRFRSTTPLSNPNLHVPICRPY